MARARFPVLIGPSLGDTKERSDYRAVPSSDTGKGYSDRGALGTYQSDREPFKCPAGVRFEEGYGASAADLERGYIEPTIREDPAYYLSNYRDRWSQRRQSDVGSDAASPFGTSDDWEFRMRNRTSKGFLPRSADDEERN